MAQRIKVKVLVTLDSADTYIHELEEKFDCDARGHDLAECIIKVASTTISDITREIVEEQPSA